VPIEGGVNYAVHGELIPDQNLSVHIVEYSCAVMKIKIVSMSTMK